MERFYIVVLIGFLLFSCSKTEDKVEDYGINISGVLKAYDSKDYASVKRIGKFIETRSKKDRNLLNLVIALSDIYNSDYDDAEKRLREIYQRIDKNDSCSKQFLKFIERNNISDLVRFLDFTEDKAYKLIDSYRYLLRLFLKVAKSCDDTKIAYKVENVSILIINQLEMNDGLNRYKEYFGKIYSISRNLFREKTPLGESGSIID